uniref:Uncharacterized protein n=1 Tax=Podarcis muralis TaxID=64176 RepID=A0A670JWE3_PODMU
TKKPSISVNLSHRAGTLSGEHASATSVLAHQAAKLTFYLTNIPHTPSSTTHLFQKHVKVQVDK